MSIGDKLHKSLDNFFDVVYKPVDKLGDLGAEVSGKIVDKTNISKHSYGLWCNIAGGIVGSATAIDGYSNGMEWVGILGGFLTVYHGLGAVYHYRQRDVESSKEIIEQGTGKAIENKAIKEAKSDLEKIANKTLRHSAGMVLISLGLGASFLGYQNFWDIDVSNTDYLTQLRILGSFGTSLFLGGVEGLFRGSKSSK